MDDGCCSLGFPLFCAVKSASIPLSSWVLISYIDSAPSSDFSAVVAPRFSAHLSSDSARIFDPTHTYLDLLASLSSSTRTFPPSLYGIFFPLVFQSQTTERAHLSCVSDSALLFVFELRSSLRVQIPRAHCSQNFVLRGIHFVPELVVARSANFAREVSHNKLTTYDAHCARFTVSSY